MVGLWNPQGQKRGFRTAVLPKLEVEIFVTHIIKVIEPKKFCRNFAENDETMSIAE